MTAWHDAQAGLARCCSSRWRSDVALTCAAILLEVGLDAGRRLRRRRAEQVLQDPLAALDRRRAVAGRGDGQDAALAEQAAPRAVGSSATRRIRLPRTSGNAVVPREPLVHEREVGVEQIDDAAVFADDRPEQQLGFALERLPQVAVEIRRIGPRRSSVPAGAATGRRSCRPALGARVGQHPPHLLFEHRRILQRAARRRVQQLVVRECCSRGRTTAATRARDRSTR